MLIEEMRRVRVVIGSKNEGFSLVQGLASCFLVLGDDQPLASLF
jgi:hypothetical protein